MCTHTHACTHTHTHTHTHIINGMLELNVAIWLHLNNPDINKWSVSVSTSHIYFTNEIVNECSMQQCYIHTVRTCIHNLTITICVETYLWMVWEAARNDIRLPGVIWLVVSSSPPWETTANTTPGHPTIRMYTYLCTCHIHIHFQTENNHPHIIFIHVRTINGDVG